MQNKRRIDIHGRSLNGRENHDNQDHFAIATLRRTVQLRQSNLRFEDEAHLTGDDQGHLLLVADGIGTGPAPSRASSMAIDSVVQYFLDHTPWYHTEEEHQAKMTATFEDAVRHAQDALLDGVGPDGLGMGTTLTLALVSWPHLYLAHVGDCRAYLLRNGQLRRLTTDHTLAEVRRQVEGEITPTSERMLWNAVGGRETPVHAEICRETLRPGDVLALITDGVLESQTEVGLGAVLSRDRAAKELCRELVPGAGQDDRTVVVARFPEALSVGLDHPVAPALAAEAQPQVPVRAPSQPTPGPIEDPRHPSSRRPIGA